MEEKKIFNKMEALEQKVDKVLEYVNQQRLKSEAVEDLISDVSMIGKDVYNTAVIELDKQSVELDPDELTQLGINLVKNIKNFNEMLVLIDSLMDLKKDAVPILNELIIEFTKKLNDLEIKGYFNLAKEVGYLMDNVVKNFSAEDIRTLSNNIGLILQILKNVTRPELLNDINKAIEIYDGLQNESTNYSIWKIMREANSPEVRSALGFMLTFVKRLSQQNVLVKGE